MKKLFVLTGMMVAFVTASHAQQKIPPPKPTGSIIEPPPPPPKVDITKFSAPPPPPQKVEVTKFRTPTIKKKPSFRKLRKPVSNKDIPKVNMTRFRPPVIVRDSVQ